MTVIESSDNSTTRRTDPRTTKSTTSSTTTSSSSITTATTATTTTTTTTTTTVDPNESAKEQPNHKNGTVLSQTFSVRVKLIKAVDLPGSLAPNTPTCPRFKLGLLPLHGPESTEDLQKLLHPVGGDSDLHSPTNSISKSSTAAPSANTVSNTHVADSRSRISILKASVDRIDTGSSTISSAIAGKEVVKDADVEWKTNESVPILTESGSGSNHSPTNRSSIRIQKHNTLTEFRTHVPITSFHAAVPSRLEQHYDTDIKFSSMKILSKKDFGAMDWQEEFVWDGILSPSNTVLAVELCTILVPNVPTVPSTSSSMTNATNSFTSRLKLTTGDSKLQQFNTMLRRSHIKNSPSLPSIPSLLSTSSSSTSTSTSTSSSKRNTSADAKISSTSNNSSHSYSGSGSTHVPSLDLGSDHHYPSKHNSTTTYNYDLMDPEKDLRIGTLLIPLSRLPLHESENHDSYNTHISPPKNHNVDIDHTTNIVEKWYQLQSMASHNTASNRGKVGVNLLPSVLLSISIIKGLPYTRDDSMEEQKDEEKHPTRILDTNDLVLEHSLDGFHHQEKIHPQAQHGKCNDDTMTKEPLAPRNPPLLPPSQPPQELQKDLQEQTESQKKELNEKTKHVAFVSKTTPSNGESSMSSPFLDHPRVEEYSPAPYRKRTGSFSLLPSVSFAKSVSEEDSSHPSLSSFSMDRPRLDEYTPKSYRKRTGSVGLLPSPSVLRRGAEEENLLQPSLSEEGENLESLREVGCDDMSFLLQNQENDHHDDGPYLSPGIIDYILVVGPNNLHDDKASSTDLDEMGKKGWLLNQPDCCLLEQFPPAQYNQRVNGRKYDVPSMVEWFCFPEGCTLWRGEAPPSRSDLNMNSAFLSGASASPYASATSTTQFDSCLNCASSFYWWVTCANSGEYGSQSMKIYGAVIRFYAPTPSVEPTQSRNAISTNGRHSTSDKFDGVISETKVNRIWSPICICITSSLPIVGIMEEILLRICEGLASQTTSSAHLRAYPTLMHDIIDLILRFPSPVPSVVNVSIPFLRQEQNRILVTLPPVNSLPPLPHGCSVTNACRLLGGEGLVTLLAAMLTECKIILTSTEISNLAMVGEVACALIYPFKWQLPYVPVLPLNMLEFLDAPLSFLLGVPSMNMKFVDCAILRDVVVIDLDKGRTNQDNFEQRRSIPFNKAPCPFPNNIHQKLVDSVNNLLRVENELIEEHFGSRSPSKRPIHSQRLDCETVAERDFRLKVASMFSSLIRGYQDNISFVSADKPVFNNERFLRQAPILLEEKSPMTSQPSNTVMTVGVSNTSNTSQYVACPKAKAFLSQLVNTQQFHGLIENLDNEEAALFHDLMDSLEPSSVADDVSNSSQLNGQLESLTLMLEKREVEVPTYVVKRKINSGYIDTSLKSEDVSGDKVSTPFTYTILSPFVDGASSGDRLDPNYESSNNTVQSTLQHLDTSRIPKWCYRTLFSVKLEEIYEHHANLISLKEAIGEERYIAWERLRNLNRTIFDDALPEDSSFDRKWESADENVVHSSQTTLPSIESVDQSESDAITNIKICLDYVVFGTRGNNERKIMGTLDMTAEAETALRNASVRSYLLSALNKRAQSDDRQSRSVGSKAITEIRPDSFRCLLRLCMATIESCWQENEYGTAYKLLTNTAGYCTVLRKRSADVLGNDNVVYLAKQIHTHPIFQDIRLWETVLALQKKDKQSKSSKNLNGLDTDTVLYEAAVSTVYEMIYYGVPAYDVIKFATQIAQNNFAGSAKGHQLLLYVRRLAKNSEDMSEEESRGIRLDEDKSREISEKRRHMIRSPSPEDFDKFVIWEDVAWYHPSCNSYSVTNYPASVDGAEKEKNIYKQVHSISPQNSIHVMSLDDDETLNADGYLGRSPVTCLTSVGSSVVLSGALDGSLFFRFNNLSPKDDLRAKVSGLRVQCSSNRPGNDSELNSVSCLAIAKYSAFLQRPSKHVIEDLMTASYGRYVLAGTSQGDLRAWSLKGIYSRFKAEFNEEYREDDSVPMELYDGVSFTGGHQGGVNCFDIPSDIYCPNAFISGGNDSLIKLWSFRPHDLENPPSNSSHPSSRLPPSSQSAARLMKPNTLSTKKPNSDLFDPKVILNGHVGKVVSLKSAWHGDLLVSGATDSTVRLWDIGEKFTCINTLKGHSGCVTHLQYWSGNTIVSGSSDRSVCIWDSRTGINPSLTLRYHLGPISDLVLGSRKEYSLVSAASDGLVASWDLRQCKTIRGSRVPIQDMKAFTRPRCVMRHGLKGKNNLLYSGSTYLAMGFTSAIHQQNHQSLISVGIDGSVNEWDLHDNGKKIAEHRLIHSDAISQFFSFTENDNLLKCESLGGYISSSWDGSVRLRYLRRVEM